MMQTWEMCHACEILIGGEEITEENWAQCRDYIKMCHGEMRMKFIKLYVDKFQLQAFLNMVQKPQAALNKKFVDQQNFTHPYGV